MLRIWHSSAQGEGIVRYNAGLFAFVISLLKVRAEIRVLRVYESMLLISNSHEPDVVFIFIMAVT